MLIAFIIMTAVGLYDEVVASGVIYGIVALCFVLLIILIVCTIRQKILTL